MSAENRGVTLPLRGTRPFRTGIHPVRQRVLVVAAARSVGPFSVSDAVAALSARHGRRIAAGHHKEGVVLERFSAWLRAHGWTLLVLLFLPLAGMALFPFAHSLLSSGKTPPVAMNDDAQLILFVTGSCGLLLMGFLLLAHSRNRNARLRQESMERSLIPKADH